MPRSQQAGQGKTPGPLSPQRIWKTVATAVLALVVYGVGILTGLYMGQPSGAGISLPVTNSSEDVAVDSMPALARANFYMEKGVAMMNEGQRSAAVSQFRKSLKAWEAAIQEEPDNLYAQTYQGLTYYYAGDSKQALASLRAVLEKDANYLWALFNLGWIYETGDKKAEAITMYRKYVEVAPEEKKDQLKYAEQYELIDRQVEAAQKAIERLSGGGDGK